jgi:methionyl-tRNA synthetase
MGRYLKLKIIKLSKMISYDDFKKVEMKVGEIKEVEVIEGSDKLLKLKVDFGLKQSSTEDRSPEHPDGQDVLGEERDIRQILSGIRKFFDDYNVLVGKKVPFVINLEPRKMMGLESQGMILAVNDDEGNFSLLEVDGKIKSGSSVS